MGLFSLAKLFGITIRESANDGSDFTNPDADYRRLFLGEDGQLHVKDSAGAVTDIGAASGSVATDTIWDTKGDLAVGTGANTAAKLVVGANDTVPMADSGETTGIKWVASQTPSTQAFSDAAAQGTADTYARGDHKHGMPASPGGSTPGWVSWFVGTTDSTNFYWDGNDLAGFTEQTVTGTTTWAENGNSIQAQAVNQTADDASCQLIAQTINTGDQWMLAINMTFLGSDVGNSTAGHRDIGILMTDGTATSSNCVIGHVQIDNGGSSYVPLLVGRTGTLTNTNSAAPWVSQNPGPVIGNWLFIRLKYSASNTFQLAFGPSPYQVSSFGEADISKTMTPSHIGLYISEQNAGTALGMFGPLKKV